MAHEEMLLRTERGNPSYTVEMWLTVDDDRITFAERRTNQPTERIIWTPAASRDTVVGFLEQWLALPPTGTADDRLVGCFRALADRGLLDATPDGSPIGKTSGGRYAVMLAWQAAGVETQDEDIRANGRRVRNERHIPLRVTRTANGERHALTLALNPFWAGLDPESGRGIRLTASVGRPGERGANASFEGPYRLLEQLVGHLEAGTGTGGSGDRTEGDPTEPGEPNRRTRADLETGLIACLTGLIDRGELPESARPHVLRDRAAAIVRAAGLIPLELRGTTPYIDILDVRDGTAGDVRLTVSYHANQLASMIEFVERRGRQHHGFHQIKMPYPYLETVLAHVHRPPDGTDGEDRLTAHLRSMVDSGELDASHPDGAAADRVADLFEQAGAPTSRGFTRHEHTLLESRHTDSNSWFALQVAYTFETVTFDEIYEYSAQPGDPGREYIYGLSAPHAALTALVASFESRLDRPGDGDLATRFTACLAELVRRGELADRLPIRANRERMIAWFARAAVPYDISTWVS